jgi:dihydrofolate reductase
MSKRKIACILATNLVSTIGDKGKLPWHLPDDLARFKRITSGNTIVIGRRTHESLQEFRDTAIRAHDRKVKETWEWFDSEKATLETQGHSEAKLKRLISKKAYQRDLSLSLIHPVYPTHSLPNRKTIVVSKTMAEVTDNPNIVVVRSVDEAIVVWRARGQGTLYCAGGAELYKEFWPHMELLHLTLLNNSTEGDTKYPFELAGGEWRMLARQIMRKDDGSGEVSHTFFTMDRKGA